ncbi:uncharacterized protein LOC106084696 [Stomoxys calcitrans]|uniref:uncharacterized protein LOC106084696 n=1 Tax=Stomoxys calcitrans TaxID=35570 RepID=UPI0027E309E8|nr:uncharacterized protein LOC106084696 [Stomoxys calcitrans]
MCAVAFRGKLAENLRFGHILEISGKAKNNAESFRISLKSSKHDQYVGLQIVVIFHDDKFFLKNCLNGEWSDEVPRNFDTSVFKSDFKIYIAMGEENFHININKSHLEYYKYRKHPSLMTIVEIDGDLDYIRQLDHRKYFPYLWPPSQAVERQRLQFSAEIPMSFRAGHVIKVAMTLHGNANGTFVTRLRNIRDMEREEFHMSVRFGYNALVRNAKNRLKEDHYIFGEEERSGSFPFTDFSQAFVLAFAFTDKELKVAKDGKLLFAFHWRTFDVLPLIAGLKLDASDDVKIVVSQLEHIQMEDDLCRAFEHFSVL